MGGGRRQTQKETDLGAQEGQSKTIKRMLVLTVTAAPPGEEPGG